MSKSKSKDFSAGLGSVFSSSAKEGTPVEVETKENKAERATFIISKELLEDTKDIAYWDRRLYKDVIEAALSSYVKAWKKEKGELKPRPDDVKEREKERSNLSSSGRKKNK